MFLTQIYDSALSQYAYLIACQRTGEALIIDPERDIDRYLEIAAANDFRITAVTETHIHADFLSGTREFLQELTEVTAYLSDMGTADWKYSWAEGDPRVRLLRDGDSIEVGNIEVKAVHTPGHTPEHLSFLIIDHGGGATEPMGMATGDFVFVGDVGRPDLLESAAGQVGAREPELGVGNCLAQAFTASRNPHQASSAARVVASTASASAAVGARSEIIERSAPECSTSRVE